MAKLGCFPLGIPKSSNFREFPERELSNWGGATWGESGVDSHVGVGFHNWCKAITLRFLLIGWIPGLDLGQITQTNRARPPCRRGEHG